MDVSEIGSTAEIEKVRAIARTFWSHETPVRLPGGQWTVWRTGNLILKPVDSVAKNEWLAELFSRLPESPEARIARPARDAEWKWISDGYVAWSRLDGEHRTGRHGEKMRASRAFHGLLSDFPRPAFLGTAEDSWTRADRFVLEDDPVFEYHGIFLPLYERVRRHLRPVDATFRLTHGDIGGNFLCADGLVPAIIDFSPAWAPDGFAEGVMLADMFAYESDPEENFVHFGNVPNIAQNAWRGALRRILEQAWHVDWFGKSPENAIRDALPYERALEFFERRFGS